jgi:MoxR-like ATPase
MGERFKMSFTNKQSAFINAAVSYNENVVAIDFNSVNKTDLTNIANSADLKFPHWLTRVSDYKVGRGLWKIPVNGSPAIKAVADSSVGVEKAPESIPVSNIVPAVEDTTIAMTKGSTSTTSAIPDKDPLFVSHGHFSDVNSILKSEMFYPVFVTGLSGNGKTFMIEQACAKAKRELFRVNITTETDEDDLLGGFRLVNGETVWFDGPVVEAMKKGAVLLLDEVDLASTKIMCLQPVLEGKGVFLKKINEWVKCSPGFNIVATANTKGKGDDSGNFIGTGVLNEAFLERFPITVEQEYPSNAVEKKILEKVFDKLGLDDSAFIDKLVNWADIIRKTYIEGAIDELITTRRLVHISNAYKIFNMDRMKAISMCVNRFDDETKSAMVDLYTKVDAEATATPEATDSFATELADDSATLSGEVPW